MELLDRIISAIDEKLKTILITGRQIIVQSISEINKHLGLFQSGELRFGNSVEPGRGFTGIRFGNPPSTYGGIDYSFAVVNNDAIVSGFTSSASLYNILDYSGWIPVLDVWTRTGNHTFTTPSDLTTKYRKGVKIRYKDGAGYKYGVIYSSSYSDPSTTVTLITNSSYVMNAATITDTYISYMDNPEGWNDVFQYAAAITAVTTNPTLGTNGTILGRWKTSGKLIFAKVRVLWGGAGLNAGSGLYNFSLPCNASETFGTISMESAAGNILDDSTSTRYALSAFVRTSDMRGIYGTTTIGSAGPITWATNDTINLSCWYEY